MTEEKVTLHPVLTPDDIRKRVDELATAIKNDIGPVKPVLLGILKGCFMFFTDLARQLDMDVDVDFVRLASYGSDTESSGQITMIKPPEMDFEGRTIVIIEDIVDTGLTLAWLKDHLESLGPKDVKICAFIDKAERRQIEVNVDYVGFKVPEGFLVGYGLDYNEKYRNLSGVFELRFNSDT